MIFTDLSFLPFLLMTVIVANFILARNHYIRILFITAASYFFYATINWQLCFLILLSTLVNFSLGSRAKNKKMLAAGIIFNIAVLGYFKYMNFFIGNLNYLFNSSIPFLNIILPVGISFYTFENISYLMDIYRKKIRFEKNILHYAFYLSFFPRIVSGPILRYSEILPQLKSRAAVTKSDYYTGIQTFVWGIFQKIVIADQMAYFVNNVFMNPSIYSSITIWLAVLAYAFQIYFDFSGYSDMAMGIARLLGFRLVQNFNLPYISTSITEFWRRWHMSLSRWIMDYIYIPLGGNRKGNIRQYINLIITMLLGGLWHGASWNFVIWGGFHGIGLALDKIINLKDRIKNIFGKIIGWSTTFLFVIVTWIFFRSRNLSVTMQILKKMFVDFSPGINWINSYLILYLPFIIVAHYLMAKKNQNPDLDTIAGLTFLIIEILGIVILAPYVHSPFIYFQF